MASNEPVPPSNEPVPPSEKKKSLMSGLLGTATGMAAGIAAAGSGVLAHAGGTAAGVLAFAGDNAIQTNADEYEKEMRKAYPELLPADEKVIFAFQDRGGAGRDNKAFTDKRIFIKDKKGMTGAKVQYLSVPYTSIKAYAIETAGGPLDIDCSLEIHASGVGKITMNFVRDVDIFAIARFFNEKVLVHGSTGAHAAAASVTPVPEHSGEGKVGGILDWLGGDASQIDPGRVEEQLKTDPVRVLMEDEKVEMAFKCGRDSFVLTSKRILQIDVKGLSGSRVEYKTILWKCLRGFSTETAGSWDRDATLTLFTNITGCPRIRQDLRKGKVDLMAIQKFFADKILGVDTTPVTEHAASLEGHQDAGAESVFAWLGDDARQIDATLVNKKYHEDPPVLQGCEHVEMAFKGRRDLTLFTTKRLLIVDVKGWSGQKVNYLSFPWSTVQNFGVRSAGAWLDKDSECLIWTDINDVHQEGDVIVPGVSHISMDFQKDKVDLMAIHRYLSARCLRTAAGGFMVPEVSVSPEIMQASPPSGVESFLNWIGDDARALDPKEVDQQLHTVNPMLQEDEHVVMAFKSGRDTMVFSTKRILIIDVQGWSGKKVEYKSIPYTSMRAFSVESAGSWDRDAQVKVWSKTYWGSCIGQDLRKGRADIIAIQSFLAAQLFGADDGSSTAPTLATSAASEAEGGVKGFLEWLGDDAHQIKAEDANELLHTSPPILQSDETVDLAFKVGRDMCLFTTKRILYVDVKGWSGAKVEYLSFPFKYSSAFDVQSAGSLSLLDSATATVYNDIPGLEKFSQDLSKSQQNIWAIHSHLHKKVMGGTGGGTNGQGYTPDAVPAAPTNDVTPTNDVS